MHAQKHTHLVERTQHVRVADVAGGQPLHCARTEPSSAHIPPTRTHTHDTQEYHTHTHTTKQDRCREGTSHALPCRHDAERSGDVRAGNRKSKERLKHATQGPPARTQHRAIHQCTCGQRGPRGRAWGRGVGRQGKKGACVCARTNAVAMELVAALALADGTWRLASLLARRACSFGHTDQGARVGWRRNGTLPHHAGAHPYPHTSDNSIMQACTRDIRADLSEAQTGPATATCPTPPSEHNGRPGPGESRTYTAPCSGR
jgi:hypothetical protein